MPITSTAPVISSTGVSAPTYGDVLSFLTGKYQGIFGSDVYLGPDSMDGQFLAVVAQAISDTNSACVAVYNSFSPQTAVGTGLSSVVKLNGIQREAATYSSVDVLITGAVGTTITNGVVSDGTNKWDLPASVTIPAGGTITVTAAAEAIGAVYSASGTVTQIVTPTLGWISVTNPSASAPGSGAESDAALRLRQTVSTSLPALSLLDSLSGSLQKLGTTRLKIYENATGTTDSNSVPAHSICVVAEGAADADIANVIALKKSPGTGTYGGTRSPVSQTVSVSWGPDQTIKFARPTAVPVTVQISLTALDGYTTDVIGAKIKTALSTWISGIPIGQKVMLGRAWTYANLSGGADSLTYEITSLTLNNVSADVAVGFDEIATCAAASVTITAA